MSGTVCVQFDYHMYGEDVGELKVFTTDDGESNDFFSEEGDKGDSWIHVTKEVSLRSKDQVGKLK